MIIGIDASRTTNVQRTGTENYALHLIAAMIELDQDTRFRLYFRDTPPADLFVQNGRVERRIIPFPRLWTHLRLSMEMLIDPPDALFVPSHVLPLVHPRNSVATIHDLGYIHYPQTHTLTSRKYLDWSTRYNARFSRHIIADSKATRADLIRLYGVAESKITIAYPAGQKGLEPVSDNTILEAIAEQYGTGRQYFVYIGTLQPRKNLATLIRAFAGAARQGLNKDIRLVLAGRKGWLYQEILDLAQSIDIADRIVFTDYVPQKDLGAILSGAIAYVLPSWYEGFGLPILEAMACKTPVICSRVSSLPEVAGDAAIMFDPANQSELEAALLQLAADKGLRRELINRGVNRAQEFTWESCARTVLEVLHNEG